MKSVASKDSKNNSNIQISKAMSYLLRHGAEKEGIPISKEGFVKLQDLLKYKTFKNVNENDIINIVKECPKKRFHLETIKINNQDEVVIRANQGHSITDLEVEMEEIFENDKINFAIHGTYYKSWDIIKNEGLNKMKRQHIHFSTALPGSSQVISGMRANCQIAIFVDLKKAIKDGLTFYRSANDVILCAGNEKGVLDPKYFLKVVDLKENKEIDLNANN